MTGSRGRAALPEERSPAGLLRRSLLALAALSIAGTAAELALLRHWKSPEQLIPWVALGVAAVATVLLATRPSRAAVRTARALAAAVAACAAAGVFEHVASNYGAGPLDYRFTTTWASMSEASRWWVAATETVGPAPSLAPGVLAQTALALLFATVRHPALAPAQRQREAVPAPAGAVASSGRQP